MQRDGLLFILVGPSGAGKNTLMKQVQTQFDDLPQLATATTRKPRAGEMHGREHLFVSVAEFQRMIANEELIEYQNVHLDDWYGTPKQTVEDALNSSTDLIADIEFLGAGRIHDAYPDNTVLIFVSPTSLQTLAERIQRRGNASPQEIEHRLQRVRFEMTYARQCHYLIVNDILEPAAEHLRRIILNERHTQRGDALGNAPRLPRPEFHSQVVALVAQEDRVLVRTGGNKTEFPTFAMNDLSIHPSVAIQREVSQLFGDSVSIDAILDDRFEHPAPHHVEFAVIPHDVYLYYYYRCHVQGTPSPQWAGWEWRHVDDLHLPQALESVVRAETHVMD